MVNVGPVDEAWARRKILLDDAETLERAAVILKLRSRRPKGITTLVFCKTLAKFAAKLRDMAPP